MINALIIIAIVIVAIVIIGFFAKKGISAKMSEQENMINKNKMTATIFVIDKKKDKIQNSNLPKAVSEQMPKVLKMKKFPLVKAKVGPQITTLICDEKLFKSIPVKKSVVVELSGIYIVGIKKTK